jgi:hypothetical protein
MGDRNIWECSILAIRKPDLAQTLKKEHGRLAASVCCSPIFVLLTHNVSLNPSRFWEPLHLVTPYETLGTATSRQTLRDSGNRNISSDPARLGEPQRLVRPFETLGTATLTTSARAGISIGFESLHIRPLATLSSKAYN